MRNLALFPWNQDVGTVMEYKDLLDGYNISAVSSFKENVAMLQNYTDEYGIYSTTNIEEALAHADTLLFLDNTGEFMTEKYFRAIQAADEKSIEILASKQLVQQLKFEDNKINHLRQLHYEYRMQGEYYTNNLLEIPVPVIAALGLGENCNKFEVQLLLKKVLAAQGYSSIHLCSNSLGNLFGMYDLPAFLFDSACSFEDKIIGFNHHLYDLCKTQKPDVVVLGFPGGIMPLGEHGYNHFSEIPLILSNAVQVDLGILNLYFSPLIDEEYMENMKTFCANKFGIPIEAFCIARQKLEYDLEFKKFDVHYFEDNLIKKLIPKVDQRWVMNLTDKAQSERIIKQLINRLEENLDAI